MKYLASIIGFLAVNAPCQGQPWIHDASQWLPANSDETLIWETVLENENVSQTAILVWSYNVTISSHYIVTGDAETGPSWSLKVATLQNTTTQVPITGTRQIQPNSGTRLRVHFYRESGWERWKRTIDGLTTTAMRSLSANQYLEHDFQDWHIVSEQGGSGGNGN